MTHLKANILLLALMSLVASCNPESEKNVVTKIQPTINNPSTSNFVVNSPGDTIPTGVPIPVKGRRIDPDSVAKPQTAPLLRPPDVVSVRTNVRLAGQPRMVPVPEKLTVVTPGEDGVPLPKAVPAHGLTQPARLYQPVTAGAMRMKDDATANLQYLTVEEGLSFYWVRSILEDSQGYIWFGFDNNGLARYDGKSFTHLTSGYVSTLDLPSIRSMLEDREGNIWLATWGGGVARYDGREFTHYRTEGGLLQDVIGAMLEDRQGNLWFGAPTGACRFSPGDETFTYFTEAGGLLGPAVRSLLEDSQGNLWFGHDMGISRFDGISFTHFPAEEIPGINNVNAICEDSQGNIWFGSGSGGAYRFDGHTFANYRTSEGLGSNKIAHILEDRHGHLWFATLGGGVNRLDGQTFTEYTETEGLLSNLVYTMLEDSRGNLWLGIRDGVSRLGATHFTHLSTNEGLLNNNVREIIEDSQGDLWFATEGALTRYVEKPLAAGAKSRSYFSHFTERQGLSTNAVISICESKEGDLWLGMGLDGGAYRFDPAGNGKLTHYRQQEGLTNDNISDILQDHAGGFWFAAGWRGVNYLDGNSFTHFTEKEGLLNRLVFAQLEDRNNHLWFGSGAGLTRYDARLNDGVGQGKFFTHYTVHEGLSNHRIHCLMEDQKGNLWIGTDVGVNRFDGKNFNHYTEKEGLIDNRAFSMVEVNGNIWVGTQAGLSLMVPVGKQNNTAEPKGAPDYQFFNFDKSDGLKQVDFWTKSVFHDRKNRIWWGGTKGLTMLDLNEFVLPTKPPIIHFAQLDIEQQYVDYRALADTAYRHTLSFGEDLSHAFDSVAPFQNYPLNLALPHDLNHLTFHFSGLDWAAQNRIRYSYFLEGYDQTWNPPTAENKADYRNLPPGAYTFKVKAMGAASASGGWSDVAEYTFRILPPWWQTIWFRAFLLALFLGILYLFMRWRTRALQDRNRELEEKVHERTQQLHKRVEELQTVNEVSRAASSELELDNLIQLIGREMQETFTAQVGYIALLDEESQMIHFPYLKGMELNSLRLGEGLTSRILLSGEPLLINEDVKGAYERFGLDIVTDILESYLGVPIPVGGENIGVISVSRTDKHRPFDEEDQRLLTTLAANVGSAIRNARLYEAARQAKEEALAAEALAWEANEAKSSFLSTVSHELRTPLTSVLGFAKIVKKRLEDRILPAVQSDDPKVQKAVGQVTKNLEVITSEGERLTQLINDVLDLAKIEAGKIEWHMAPVGIEEVFERAVQSTQALYSQKKLPLKVEVEPGLPTLIADRNKLIQVMINLLSNAVKFTKEGKVTCKAYRKEDVLIVSVTDTGVGIAPIDQPKVFEKFKQVGDTLTDKPQGTGLGLPICKEIVEHHGGRLWLESEAGKGSTFYFSLPLIAGAEAGLHPVQVESLVKQLQEQLKLSTSQSHGHGQTILVVDDDSPIRSLLRQELSEQGYVIREAANGRAAVESVRQERPDLILLDVMMPEMNGFDVAAVLKNDPATMDIPIIILSIVKDTERGMRIGVDRYLTKPIDTDQLFREVGDLLEQGKSQKKVMVVDENASTIRTLTEVLQARGYHVVEANGEEVMEKALSTQPDIIILNSKMSGQQEVVKTLRFEKGLEHVLFLVYQ